MPATPEMIPLGEEASSEALRAPNTRSWEVGGEEGGGFPKAPLFDVEN